MRLHRLRVCPDVPLPAAPTPTEQALEFSPAGGLLASLSSGGSGGSSLAFWEVGRGGSCELAAGVQLPGAVAALAWCMCGEQAALYTAGAQGLTHWRLLPADLASTAVHLPAALRGKPLTAVAWAEGEEAAAASGSRWRPQGQGDALLVGDSSGRAWLLDVDEGQDVRRSQMLAELPGKAVSCLAAAGPLAAVGGADGTFVLLAAEGVPGKGDSWQLRCCEQLDGAVVAAQLDVDGRRAAAATAAGTLWQAAPGTPPRVLLCGQAQPMRSWQLAPGASWKGHPAAAAVASAAGVSVWQLPAVSRRVALHGLVTQCGARPEALPMRTCLPSTGSRSPPSMQGEQPPARAPVVEFGMPPDATHASLADDGSCCAAAYADGSICLFEVPAARMRWQVAGAAQQGGVVGLAVVQRLRGCKVMVAYRWAWLGGAAGQHGLC